MGLHLLTACVAISALSPTLAQSPSQTQSSREKPGASQFSNEAEIETQRAAEWGLQSEEWTRYRELMRGPLGIHSPTLDPLTALGIEARSEGERRRYAELQVRIEAARVEKLLAYQRAYDEAWKRLHPTLQPVSFSSLNPSTESTVRVSASAPDRLAVFIKEQCPLCDAKVKALQAAGRTFDIYMVGSRNEDARIRAWATRVAVDPAKVRARTITLNHDAGRWLSLGGQGELPAVLREADGQWRRE